jgi:hypothetical protein
MPPHYRARERGWDARDYVIVSASENVPLP